MQGFHAASGAAPAVGFPHSRREHIGARAGDPPRRVGQHRQLVPRRGGRRGDHHRRGRARACGRSSRASWRRWAGGSTTSARSSSPTATATTSGTPSARAASGAGRCSSTRTTRRWPRARRRTRPARPGCASGRSSGSAGGRPAAACCACRRWSRWPRSATARRSTCRARRGSSSCPATRPGSAALHLPSHDVLCIGDAIATYSVTDGYRGPRIAPFGADYAAGPGVARAGSRGPRPRMVLPGHGDAFTGGVDEAIRQAREAPLPG